MKYTSFDDFFTVLGNKQRVKILQYLNEEGAKSVSDIGKKLKIEQSAVSHNMRRLLSCHFVEVKQQGKERIYTINTDTMQPLFRLIDQHVKSYCAKGCVHWE
jgi:DNA-binding transcriptional ArsR family regulator